MLLHFLSFLIASSWAALSDCGLHIFIYKFYSFHTGGPFHCYMLDESIYHFGGVQSILSLLFYFWCKIVLAINVDTDQTPHYVVSHLGLHCLPMTLLRVSG